MEIDCLFVAVSTFSIAVLLLTLKSQSTATQEKTCIDGTYLFTLVTILVGSSCILNKHLEKFGGFGLKLELPDQKKSL